MSLNKIFIAILFIILYSSCSENKEDNKINKVVSEYIKKYPIGIKNYDYIVRFYKKDRDTILEISQDRIDMEFPSDFLINFIDSVGNKSINIDYKFIKIGNTNINNKLVFIFDTSDSIGKKLYSNLKIKKEEHIIEEFGYFTYPFLPETRIYKYSNNNLIFLEETDTVKFKGVIIK